VRSVLKIQYTDNGDAVLTVSGRLQADNVGELDAALDEERLGRTLVLDLKDLVGADEDAIRFLCACERDGTVLRNCPPYIRTWMARERART
jgi:anti-anti-sigma regulatory factor